MLCAASPHEKQNVDHQTQFHITDYGYTCRYEREVKKRGRAPTSTTINHTSSTASSKQAASSASLSPPEATPDTPIPSHQLRQPDEPHRSSFNSSNQDAGDGHPRPSISQLVTAHLPSPAAVAASVTQPAYLASPVYSTSGGGGHGQMHLSSLLESTSEPSLMLKGTATHASPPQMSTGRTVIADAEVIASDDSVGYPSPANGGILPSQRTQSFRSGRGSMSTQGLASHHERGSFSASCTGREEVFPESARAQTSLYKAPSADCRYRCLDPVLPYLRDIIPASVACDLLDVYLTEPGSSLFRCASPYIITRIFRKKSLLHPTNPRRTTPALLATMLWCSAQTADIVLLHVPGSRAKICNALYELATALISDRDPDRWRRIHGNVACFVYTGTKG